MRHNEGAMVRAFVFDIGGVLVKNDEALLGAIFLALEENGLHPTDRETTFRAFGHSNYLNVETAVRTCYNGPDVANMVQRCFKTFQTIFPFKVASSFEIFPGNLEVLTHLKAKGFRLGVFSGLNRIEAEASLDALKIKGFFPVIVTLDEVKRTRPDPGGLLLAVEKLGCVPKECIYVGDTVADIQMARNAGVPIVCVKTGVQNNALLAAEAPDYFVENFDEMLKVLAL
jgi:HAD superfamily hydrolase (TIGR01509 family)